MVHLRGKLASGEPFLVRDDRSRPRFHVLQSDTELARSLGATVTPDERVDLRGRPVARVDLAVPADVPPLRDRLIRAGIPCLEADVPFATRYLIDRGVRGSVEIAGETRVVSIAIYDQVETLNYAAAHRLSLVLILFAFITLFGMFLLNRRWQSR